MGKSLESAREKILIDLTQEDIEIIDVVKEQMGVSSRGRVISALLRAELAIRPPAIIRVQPLGAKVPA